MPTTDKPKLEIRIGTNEDPTIEGVRAGHVDLPDSPQERAEFLERLFDPDRDVFLQLAKDEFKVTDEEWWATKIEVQRLDLKDSVLTGIAARECGKAVRGLGRFTEDDNLATFIVGVIQNIRDSERLTDEERKQALAELEKDEAATEHLGYFECNALEDTFTRRLIEAEEIAAGIRYRNTVELRPI